MPYLLFYLAFLPFRRHFELLVLCALMGLWASLHAHDLCQASFVSMKKTRLSETFDQMEKKCSFIGLQNIYSRAVKSCCILKKKILERHYR